MLSETSGDFVVLEQPTSALDSVRVTMSNFIVFMLLLGGRVQKNGSDGSRSRPALFSDDLFDLTDFLLYLSGRLFVLTFRRQVGVLRRSPHLLFHFTLYLMELAFCFILGALLHEFSPSLLTIFSCSSQPKTLIKSAS
jgi:hypothetical protein